MKLPTFAESNHPLIQPLLSSSDFDLVRLFQQHREQGQYFIAIFCRYGHLVYALLQNFARSALQTDYLFAKTWRRIFQELATLEIQPEGIGTETPLSFQTWILNLTAIAMHQEEVPALETIRYSLTDAPPPLWCYLEAALEQLPPTLRLILVMAQTFHWSETRIARYLQAEGEELSSIEVRQQLQEAYRLLETALPTDIKTIYLPGSASGTAIAQGEANPANLSLTAVTAPVVVESRANPAAAPLGKEESYH